MVGRFLRWAWDDSNHYAAKQGDMFDDIARQAYGDAHLASLLLCANPMLADRLTLDGDEVVEIPIIAVMPDASSPPWRTVT